MIINLAQNLSRSLVISIAALGCAAAVVMLQLPQLNALRNSSKNTTPASLKRELASERLSLNLLQKTPAFGFDNLLADWVFINFLQYFGDEPARAVTGYQLSPEYFEVIIDQDPRFLEAYLFLSGSSSLYAGMPERSVALMEKGLKSLSPQVPPQSYYVWRYKAVDELLFLGDAQAARQSFAKAAEWASTYPDPESQSVAAISRQTAEFLSRNPQSKSAQVSAWATVLNNAVDDGTRQRVIDRIEALGGKVVVTPEGRLNIQLPQVD